MYNQVPTDLQWTGKGIKFFFSVSQELVNEILPAWVFSQPFLFEASFEKYLHGVGVTETWLTRFLQIFLKTCIDATFFLYVPFIIE